MYLSGNTSQTEKNFKKADRAKQPYQNSVWLWSPQLKEMWS